MLGLESDVSNALIYFAALCLGYPRTVLVLVMVICTIFIVSSLSYQYWMIRRIARACHVSTDRIGSLLNATHYPGNHWFSFGVYTVRKHCKTEKDVERFERLRDEIEATHDCDCHCHC